MQNAGTSNQLIITRCLISSSSKYIYAYNKKRTEFTYQEDTPTPRSYLDATVVPTLLEGMKLLASER